MKLKNDKVVKLMLGFVTDQIDLIVATPLGFLFKQLYVHFPNAKRNTGFYESYLITGINGKRVLLIKTAQGIQCQDIFWPFLDASILFVGYAGGISSRVRLGVVYAVDFATHPSDYNKTIHLNRKRGKDKRGFVSMQQWYLYRESNKLECLCLDKGIKVGYSPAMIGEIADTFCNNARQSECDIVDMEISHCANVCLENRSNFEAIVLITDLPGNINFWELGINDQEVVSDGSMVLLSTVVEYIKEEVLGDWRTNLH